MKSKSLIKLFSILSSVGFALCCIGGIVVGTFSNTSINNVSEYRVTVYKSLENKDTAVDEVYGREEAIKVIKECLASYKRNIQPKVVAERKARGY